LISNKYCLYNLTRRSFIITSAQAMVGLTFPVVSVPQSINNTIISPPQDLTITKSIPPLFCAAFITPDAPGQGGQEAIVARYPIALVAQDERIQFKKWRDLVRHLNPNIILLAYQMVIEETTVPGPGHDCLRQINNSWSTYPTGVVPTVGPINKLRRIYDPRYSEWRSGFMAACRATLKAYPYSGLFLDQCTVFDRAHPDPQVRAEMIVALQNTLLELRSEFPTAYLIGNSRESWRDLNGEMNEGRIKDLAIEMQSFAGHVSPRLELYLRYLYQKSDFKSIKDEMEYVHSLGGLYGACYDHQHVIWPEAFDEIMQSFK